AEALLFFHRCRGGDGDDGFQTALTLTFFCGEVTLAGLCVNDDIRVDDVADAVLVIAGAGPAYGDEFRRWAQSQRGFDGQRGPMSAHSGTSYDCVLMLE